MIRECQREKRMVARMMWAMKSAAIGVSMHAERVGQKAQGGEVPEHLPQQKKLQFLAARFVAEEIAAR